MEATPEQVAGYKAEAHQVIQDDGSVRYYRPVAEQDMFGGMRLTDCCAAVSTYMDDGTGGQELSSPRPILNRLGTRRRSGRTANRSPLLRTSTRPS